jgi:hypothetical protein
MVNSHEHSALRFRPKGLSRRPRPFIKARGKDAGSERLDWPVDPVEDRRFGARPDDAQRRVPTARCRGCAFEYSCVGWKGSRTLTAAFLERRGYVAAFALTVVVTAVFAALSLIAWTWALIVIFSNATVMLAAMEFYLKLKRILLQGQEKASSDTVKVSTNITSAIVLRERCKNLVMPLSGYSMCASNLGIVQGILDTREPNVIVELGSGVSTMLVASWLKERGRGRIVSFDHQRAWADTTRFYLELQELKEFAEVRLAPLASNPLRLGAPWYEFGDQLGNLDQIDLLIVDGPPAGEFDPMSRLPSLSTFYHRLSRHAVVFLDDGNREGEQTVAGKWVEEFPDFNAQFVSTITGCWILERSA